VGMKLGESVETNLKFILCNGRKNSTEKIPLFLIKPEVFFEFGKKTN